jgi:2-C-methyl-D-erythritol 4-phosphate cytidylyltransferase
MGGSTAKPFLSLGGIPMVLYALRTLVELPDLLSVVLVVGSGQEERAADMLQHYGPWPVPVRLARGGAERQDSVAAGLALVDIGAELVAVHDAARPFVSLSAVQACLDAAARTGAAILAIPARDTVKLVGADHSITRTIDRHTIWLAQTPQVFRSHLLRQAYEQARRDGHLATDDAALVERLGVSVCVVSGEPANQKITTPDDLRWAEWILQSRRGSGGS